MSMLVGPVGTGWTAEGRMSGAAGEGTATLTWAAEEGVGARGADSAAGGTGEPDRCRFIPASREEWDTIRMTDADVEAAREDKARIPLLMRFEGVVESGSIPARHGG
jgi:hypothetical protein